MRTRVRATAALLAGTFAVLGFSIAAIGAGYTVDTAKAAVNGSPQTVLTDEKGMTLYYFALDTPIRSACTGGCATMWPALVSDTTPTSDGTLPGKLSLVRTANGSQVAYNGHLLYRYVGDTAPGQTNGQGIGGKWWVVGSDLKPAVMAPSMPSGGYGGYGGNNSGGGGNTGGGGGGNMGGGHY